MTTSSGQVRRPFQVMAILYLIVGIAALLYTWKHYPPALSLQFILLVASVVVVENFAVTLPGYGLSLAYPLAFASLVICGPTQSLIVAGVSMVSVSDIRAKPPVVVHFFNLGQQLLCMALAAWTYMALSGRVLIGPGGAVTGITSYDFPEILIPLAATAVVGAAGNVLLAASGYSARTGKSFVVVLKSVSWVFSAQVTMAGLGFLIAQVMAISAAALPLFVFPLLVARQLYQRYSTLNDAYYDTIRSLVAALEAKDPYTRGHSERVVMYADRLAAFVGMDEAQRGELARAALLHDIGKLAVPGGVLRKRQALTDAEWDLIRKHPSAGAEMVDRIPALRGLAPVVAQHHQWFDGTGYPADVPQTHAYARILTIADSYDAMTSNRPYREGMTVTAALEELRRSAGTHFDPGLVDAFIEATLASAQDEQDDERTALASLGIQGEPA